MKKTSLLVIVLVIFLAFALFACENNSIPELLGGDAQQTETPAIKTNGDAPANTGGVNAPEAEQGSGQPQGSSGEQGEGNLPEDNNDDIPSDEIEKPGSQGLSFLLKEDDTYEASGIGSCTDADLVIPATYEGKKVTSIGKNAFKNCTSLVSVWIAYGVTTVKEGAFYGCVELSSISIPKSMEVIDYNFWECSPQKTYFRGGAKDWCSISFDEAGNPIFGEDTELYFNNQLVTDLVISSDVTKIGSYAFSGYSGLRSVTFLKGAKVETVENYAFEGCDNLVSVTFEEGSSLNKIGYGMFGYCDKLTSIQLPEGVTRIEEYAFYYCSSLTSVTIPSSVTSIASSAFYSCSSLTYNEYENALYLGNESNPYVALIKAKDASITGCTINDKTKLVEDYAFFGCTALTSITIPDSMTSIGDYAFRYCSSLTSVTIPSSVMSIGDGAFQGCPGLTTISVQEGNIRYHSEGNCIVDITNNQLILGCRNSVIPLDGSVTRIGDGAFHSCSGLTSVTIPDSVTSIGSSAFFACSGLTSIVIPESVTSIGDGAFQYCFSLTYNEYDNALYLGNESNPYVALIKAKDASITGCTINDKTKVVAGSAFSGCHPLTSITIPEGVKSIGEEAFDGCRALTSITIPDSVTSIGDSAFRDCTSLTSITIPNSVTSIGDSAFRDCTSLTSITIPDSVTSIGDSAFIFCSKLNSITIPSSVTGIGNFVFYCTGLTSIMIPDSVTSIGNDAFERCTSLSSIDFQGTKAEWDAILKGDDWNVDTGNYTVHCTDGDVAK